LFLVPIYKEEKQTKQKLAATFMPNHNIGIFYNDYDMRRTLFEGRNEVQKMAMSSPVELLGPRSRIFWILY